MKDGTDTPTQIETRAGYSLERRRKAWEIVLGHLKSNGQGHGSYLKMVQRSIASAQESGVSIKDFRGVPIDVEAISKDDLFGFLGGTKNPGNGPQRRISDYKLAILDAYFRLVREEKWLRFDDQFGGLYGTLEHFWSGAHAPMTSFYEGANASAWITSQSAVSEKIQRASDGRSLSSLNVTAVGFSQTEKKSIFRVTQVRIPCSSSYFSPSYEFFDKLRYSVGGIEEHHTGISIATGAGCLVHQSLGRCQVYTALRDDITREPRGSNLEIRSPYSPRYGPTFSFFSVLEGTAQMQRVGLHHEDCGFQNSDTCIFNDRFFECLSQIFSNE